MIRQSLAPLAVFLFLGYGCSDNAPDTKSETQQPATAETKQAAPASGTQTPTSAPGFCEAAAVGDLYEVQSSRLATMKAGAAEVRQFAEMMIADHTATTEQLKQIVSATTPAIALPMQPDERHQNLLSELMMLEGADFDRRYVAQQTDAHREAVMLMEGFAERGDQQDLKQFAAATAPKIRMHLQMVEELGQRHP